MVDGNEAVLRTVVSFDVELTLDSTGYVQGLLYYPKLGSKLLLFVSLARIMQHVC